MIRKSRLAAWRAAVAAAAVGLCAPGAAASTRHIDYLYVEANEGGSSGGHVAIRFAQWTFHFQQRDGFLRLQRDDSATFVHSYAMLGNRSLRELRIAVTEDTYELLREAFSRRHMIETAQFERLEHLRRDVAFFAWLAGESAADEPALALPAAGLFYPDQGELPTRPLLGEAGFASKVVDLRARIEERHGTGFLATTISGLRRALQAPASAVATNMPILSPASYPLFAPTASQQWREHMLRLLGLEIIRDGVRLRADAYHVLDAEPELTRAEREWLRAAADELATALVRLPTSLRPDWGLAFIVGLGRLEALDAGLRRGRLALLGGHQVDALPVHRAPAPMREAFVRETASDVSRARSALLGSDRFHESDLSVVEVAAARLRAVRAAAAHGGLPLASTPLYPTLLVRDANPVRPTLSPAAAAAQHAAARTVVRDYEDALRRLYGYDLIRRNCVSELFAVVDSAFAGLPHVQATVTRQWDPHRPGGDGAPPPTQNEDAVSTRDDTLTDAIAEESRRRLGGTVSTRANLLFIPWLSASAVADRYAVVAQRTQPSFRRQQLAALYAQSPRVWAYAQEFNTVTSTLYVPAAGDSPFLFFTDDVVLGRPLLGIANFGFAFAHGAVGLVASPFDRGRRLRAALRGMVSSVPELVFANVRKGSLPFVARRSVYATGSASGGSGTCTSSTCGAN